MPGIALAKRQLRWATSKMNPTNMNPNTNLRPHEADLARSAATEPAARDALANSTEQESIAVRHCLAGLQALALLLLVLAFWTA